MEIASGDSHVVNYRLDYHWTATISYRNTDKVISQPVLKKRALQVNVPPPKEFTGTWIIWHVDGQKSHETQNKNGKYDGVLTSYHDNGAKSVEQHYSDHVVHRTDTGWYPNGKLSYTAQYRNGKQDGKWTHWYANGIKQSETNYDNGKYNGRSTRWYEDRQTGSVNDYKDGAKHGIEASWDENGGLQYERVYVNGEIVD
jgi:antitoxin component YwqK of YwqJK toxin-antitoxin module